MFNEFENEPDSWRPDPPKWTVIVKKTISYALALFVIVTIGFLVFRSILSQPPKAMKEVVWDDDLIAAYNSAKAEGKELEINQISTPNSFSESSMFSVYTIVYIPSLEQLQITLRYNDRALNYLYNDYPEAKALGKDDEIYKYHLSYKKDDSAYTVSSYRYTKAHKGGYTYRRLIFDGIPFEGVAGMTLGISYIGLPSVTRESILIYNGGYTVFPFNYKTPKATKNIYQAVGA